MNSRRLSAAVLVIGTIFVLLGVIQLLLGSRHVNADLPSSIPSFLLADIVLLFGGAVGMLLNRRRDE